MKRLLIALLLLSTISNAQPVNVLQNGDLDIPGGCTDGDNHSVSGCPTFTTLSNPSSGSSNCIPQFWIRSHGTPDWQQHGPNQENGKIRFWSEFQASTATPTHVGEGIHTWHTFSNNSTFWVRLKFAEPLPLDGYIQIRLTDNSHFVQEPPLPSSDCGETFPISSSNQSEAPNIGIVRGLASTPNKSDYIIEFTTPTPIIDPVTQIQRFWEKLWIYPVIESGDHYEAFLDFVHIYEENPCGDDIVENDVTAPIQTGLQSALLIV